MGFLARNKLKTDLSTRSAKNQAAVHFDVVGEDLIVLIPNAEYENGTKKDNSSGEPAYDTNTIETYEDDPEDPALPQSALLMSISQPGELGEDNLEGYDLRDITLTSGDCEKARLKLGIESSIDLTQEYYTDLTIVSTSDGDIVYGGNAGDPEPGTDMGGPQISGPGGPKIGGMSAFWVNKVVEATTKIVDKNNNVILAELVDGTKATWQNVDENWVASVVGQINNSFRQVDTSFIITEKMDDFVEVDVVGVPIDDIVVDFKFEIGYGPQTGYQTSAYGSYDSDKLDVVSQLAIVDTPMPAAPIQMQSVF